MLGESHTAGVKENQDGGHKEASSGALPLTWEMTKRAAEMWNSKAQPDQYTHWNSWEKKKKSNLKDRQFGPNVQLGTNRNTGQNIKNVCPKVSEVKQEGEAESNLDKMKIWGVETDLWGLFFLGGVSGLKCS